MRPLKLIMRAFGPYAGEQVIDFTQLKGHNLFLITGPTGAGKTTIFDALCYAIYGKASGKDRDGESLRSHFAASDLLTSVELTFSLKGKDYHIRRVPKQLRPRARGGGFTEQNAEAELSILSDNSAPIVGVRQVDEKITQIIGLNYQQFRQIIMIPQGEFRELLIADSSERENILQRIFGTEIFRLIQQKLSDREKNLRSEIKDLENQRKGKIQNLDASNNPELEALLADENWSVRAVIEQVQEGISRDKKLLAEYNTKITDLEKLIESKRQEIFIARENNCRLAERDKAELRKQELEKQKSYYTQQEITLEKARKALTLKGIEEYYLGNKRICEKRKTEYDMALAKEEQANVELEQARKKLEAELKREDERQRLNEQLVRFKSLTVKIKEYKDAQKQLSAIEKDKHEIVILKEDLRKNLEETKQEIINTQRKLEEAFQAENTYLQKEGEKDKVSRILRSATELLEETAKLNQMLIYKEKLERQHKRQKEIYENKQKEFEISQKKYLQSLAGVLAENLHEGEACPVCGSVSHPQPAFKGEGVLSQQELTSLEEELVRTREEYEQSKTAWDKVNADYLSQQKLVARVRVDLDKDLEEKNIKEQGLDKIIVQLKDHLKAVERELEQIDYLRRQKEILREKLQKSSEKQLILENDLESLTEKEKNYHASVCSLQETIANFERDLPPDIRSEADLQKKIDSINKKYQELTSALEKARNTEQEYKQRVASAVVLKDNTYKNLTEAKQELEKTAESFAEARKKAGFNTIEEYQAAKIDEQEIILIAQRIRDYQEALKSATDYLKKISLEVQGLVEQDLTILEEEAGILLQQKNSFNAEQTIVTSRKNHNENLLTGILELENLISQKEREYFVIGDLAKTAKGDNSQRLSFERYVLAAYFDDIIVAANIRLHKMTFGRYRMSRIFEKGKGLAQSGLEIEVFDYYTGRSRHVKTLSGGESFKASLALALGLSDVVQAYAGGVSLDTMFIDEGFGTLDSESLDSAIECLSELQQAGRLVGIISHVPELKASIPVKLEVSAAKDGSVASFVIDI